MSSGTRLSIHERLFQRSLLLYGRISKGMTLGVRAVLIKDAQVLLVRHTYLAGWYLPGGGVDAGETVGEALRRELREEAGVDLDGPAQLFSIYRNSKADRRDHVALFVCPAWQQPYSPKVPNLEIAAVDLFPLASLPTHTTPATRQRLDEVLKGDEPAADW